MIASDVLTLDGGTLDDQGFAVFPSSLLAEVGLDVLGDGADLNVRSQTLRILNGAQVSTSTFGAGNGGTLTVNAHTVELAGGTFDLGSSGFYLDVADFLATGQGGQLILNTDSLLIRDGAFISAGSFGLGDAGRVNIQAQAIDLVGGNPDLGPSGIFVQSQDLGAGGQL